MRDSLATGLDSLATGLDSLAVGADSLAVADSLAAPLDTTRIGYLMGIGNARIFRRDMQVRSDSNAAASASCPPASSPVRT